MSIDLKRACVETLNHHASIVITEASSARRQLSASVLQHEDFQMRIVAKLARHGLKLRRYEPSVMITNNSALVRFAGFALAIPKY